ncbi:MAG: endo-1,4-beta-xylanase [Sphingomonas sp.]|uniref:endo-1,4-beta-xylanase n=1 Tax=Sphingomonas sp. TaxID=28214 RepID=UPI00356B31D5
MSGISRREGLMIAAGMVLTACAGSGPSSATGTMTGPSPTPAPTPTSPTSPTASLNSAARARGMRFGSTYAWSTPGADRGSFANPPYAALLEADCGILVPENEMKWQFLRPSATAFDFTRPDAMIAYAESKGLAVRGHNLLWHQPKWMPAWAESHDYGPNPAIEGDRVLTEHIRTVCARYGAKIGSYDVVNEAVNPADASLYETALSRAIGGATATLDLAFHTARTAAPHAQLVYNDYMSWEPGNANHRAGVLRLLEGFRTRGTPVDALGVQSHLITQRADTAASVSTQQADWRRFLDQVVAMGYKLLITEFDVRDNNLPADIAARDRAVADYSRAYLDVMFAYPQLSDVLVWGMCDRYSWIEGFEPRSDGAKRRPCPYDSDFKPKPMRTAFAEAFAAAPART